MNYQQIIDKYYPAGSPLRDIYMKHCRAVADLALDIARRKLLPLDPEEVEAAAMLHDIGIFQTDAPSIQCFGKEPYIRHGIIGADILRRESVAESIARVAERHTGAGLTAQEIARQNLPLPRRDFLPETLIERLVCYADKFYSKSGDMNRKPIERVRASKSRFGADSERRFEALHAEFS